MPLHGSSIAACLPAVHGIPPGLRSARRSRPVQSVDLQVPDGNVLDDSARRIGTRTVADGSPQGE